MANFPYFEENGTGDRVTPPEPDLDYPEPPAACGNSTLTGDVSITACGIYSGSLNVDSNVTAPNFIGNVSAGVVISTSGFVSIANTTPIQIILDGNLLTFSAVGIGSTTFILS
jgi:hypothetical protein